MTFVVWMQQERAVYPSHRHDGNYLMIDITGKLETGSRAPLLPLLARPLQTLHLHFPTPSSPLAATGTYYHTTSQPHAPSHLILPRRACHLTPSDSMSFPVSCTIGLPVALRLRGCCVSTSSARTCSHPAIISQSLPPSSSRQAVAVYTWYVPWCHMQGQIVLFDLKLWRMRMHDHGSVWMWLDPGNQCPASPRRLVEFIQIDGLEVSIDYEDMMLCYFIQ